MKAIRSILTLAGLFFFSTAIYSSTYAVLPVKIKQINSSHLQTGNRAEPIDNRLTPWELARTVYLYLKAGKVNNIIAPQKVEKVFRELGIHPNHGLSLGQLKTVAQKLDVDNLLITEITGSDKSFFITGTIYYSHSGLLTDEIQEKGYNAWELLGRYARIRFQSSFFVKFAASSRGFDIPLTIAIDARGRSFAELGPLSKALRLYPAGKSSVISVNGYNHVETSGVSHDKLKIIDYVQNIPCKGNDKDDNLYYTLLKNIVPDEKSEKKSVILLVVSGAPRSDNSRQRVRGKLRILAQEHHVHIIGSPRMSPSERVFWKNAAAEKSSRMGISYANIIYRQKVGLSSGHQFFLFLNGDDLYQNSIDDFKTAKKLNISKNGTISVTPENATELYETFSGLKVITKYRPTALAHYSLEPIFSNATPTSEENSVRVLLDIDGKPFWITLPRSQIFDRSGKLILEKEKTYYFMLYLLPGQKGMPFLTDSGFGMVLQYNDTSKYLTIDINDYLKNPQRYLNHSIGGSSLFIIRAKVRIIRIRSTERY
ncbi:MAG: hypothetical protein ABUK01_02310 [Leptospirales bacterium]